MAALASLSSCAGSCAVSGCWPSPGSSRWPSAIAIVSVIGVFTILFGVALLVLGVRLRRLRS
jgi:hypothetical protein